ncbi:MAG: DinB family protein [Thermomicrobiales bacterium]
MDEAAVYLQQIRTMSDFLVKQIDEVPADKFHERPGPHLNTVGWNVFHLLRIWDLDLNWIARGQSPQEDAWHRGGFSEKAAYEPLGKGGRELGLGFGYTDADVDELAMPADVLKEYHQMLLGETAGYLESADAAELHREIEREGQQTETPAARIQHTIGHCWNHIGEMRYAKGMLGMSDPSYPGR